MPALSMNVATIIAGVAEVTKITVAYKCRQFCDDRIVIIMMI